MSNSKPDKDAKGKGTTTQYLEQQYTVYYNNIHQLILGSQWGSHQK